MNRKALMAIAMVGALLLVALVATVCGVTLTDARLYVHSESADSTWCSWGGARYNEQYPWAVPRDKVNNDWYCNWVHEQAVALQEARNSSNGYDFILYGDSLTQCLRNWGAICDGATDWFSNGWGKNYRTINLALGVENTDTLMWRLLNGQSPEGQNAKLIFLMIGSNSIYDGVDYDTIKDTVPQRIIAIVEYIQSATPGTQILLMGLLPKTGYEKGRPSMRQNDAIRDTNAYVNNALSYRFQNSQTVNYVYCGEPFLNADGASINTDLMIDGLHPNGKGWELIGNCLQPYFDKYMPKS